jgi:hypothetical protein
MVSGTPGEAERKQDGSGFGLKCRQFLGQLREEVVGFDRLVVRFANAVTDSCSQPTLFSILTKLSQYL